MYESIRLKISQILKSNRNAITKQQRIIAIDAQKYSSIKSKAKIRTAAVGLITNAKHAQDVIFYNKADFTFLARELLRDPYWPIRAAIELNQSHKLSVPGQYYLAWRDQEDFQFNGLNIQ